MALTFEPPTRCEPPMLADGTVLAGRYTVLHKLASGWLAYDERLARPVRIDAIAGDGAPSERVRRAAASGIGLLDAVLIDDVAFAVRVVT
jgi:hypothetical protein